MTSYEAAWVPDDDPTRPWDDAVALAVPWVRARARPGTAIVVTPTRHQLTYTGPLSDFATVNQSTTPRSRTRVTRGGPVLAYVPGAEELALAISLAHISALCVVETHTNPVAGWAAEAGAVNLLRPDAVPRRLDPDLAEALERLRFYGTSAFTHPLDKDRARGILRDLHAAEKLDPVAADQLVSALAAMGVRAHGLTNLRKLITATGRR
jgi:hypothetical protein